MSIQMTERAARQLRCMIENQGLSPSTALRVSVKGGGCSGFEYDLDFSETAADGDEIMESQGITIYCDKKSFLYLRGLVLDYDDQVLREQFVFTNPNATNVCGCGISFSV